MWIETEKHEKVDEIRGDHTGYSLVPIRSYPKMDTKNWLQIFYALNFFLSSIASVKNSSSTVKVLAVVFPPFTQVDTNHKIVSGIDVQILKTIANQMKLKLNLVRTDSIASIPTLDQE